jgi:hypothetical protein
VDFLFYAAGQMDISKEDILEELEKRNGIVSIACKSIGLARSTFYNWMQNDPKFKEDVDELQEVALDFVESKLMEKINGVAVKKGEDDDGEAVVYDLPPSDTAIIFYLKTRGKKRGYIEKSEHDLNLSGGVTVNLIPTPDCEPIKDEQAV